MAYMAVDFTRSVSEQWDRILEAARASEHMAPSWARGYPTDPDLMDEAERSRWKARHQAVCVIFARAETSRSAPQE